MLWYFYYLCLTFSESYYNNLDHTISKVILDDIFQHLIHRNIKLNIIIHDV